MSDGWLSGEHPEAEKLAAGAWWEEYLVLGMARTGRTVRAVPLRDRYDESTEFLANPV